MLAIDSKGDVYPCPAMPLLLGNLQNITFREIVASSLKNETRKKILRRPDGCSGCRIIEDCRGGCRGRGYYDHNLDIVDPGCGTIVNGRFEA
jgi:GeoRSP system SPASM domain protein